MTKMRNIARKFVSRRRILEGVRAVRVEEAAAVGAELLDGFLRGDRALRDRLRAGPSSRRHDVVRLEVLDDSLRDEHQRDDDADGQQNPEQARVVSTQKLPIVSCSRRAMPRMKATASAMPTAAETKLWYASPAIWVR